VGVACSRHGREGKYNTYKSLVWKPEGKRPFGRHRSRWKNNIKIDPGKTEWDSVD
jgi:hypothetical protein